MSSLLVILFTRLSHIRSLLWTPAYLFHIWEQRMEIAIASTAKLVTTFQDVRAFTGAARMGGRLKDWTYTCNPDTTSRCEYLWRTFRSSFQGVCNCGRLWRPLCQTTLNARHTSATSNLRTLTVNTQRSTSSQFPSHQYLVSGTGLENCIESTLPLKYRFHHETP